MRTLKKLETNGTILAVVMLGFAACGLAQQAETKVLARNVIGLENVKPQQLRNADGSEWRNAVRYRFNRRQNTHCVYRGRRGRIGNHASRRKDGYRG